MLFKIILLFSCAAVCVNCDESILCYKTVSQLKIQRVDSDSDNKTISFWVTKKVKTCCEGYLPVNVTVFTQNLDILCDPICEPACSNRQFCEKPGKCSCYPGYKENTNVTTVDKICTPICMDCDERFCIGPNICSYPPVTRPNHFANIFRATTGKPINSMTTISKDANYFANIFKATNIKPTTLTTTLRSKASYPVGCQNCTPPSERNSTVKEDDKFARILLNIAQATWNRNKSPTTTLSGYRYKCPNCPRSSETNLSADSDLSFKIFGHNATSKTYLNDNKNYKELNSTSTPMDSPRMPATIQTNTNSSNTTQSQAELKQNSWMEDNGISVLLPVVSVLAAVSVVMLLLLWHRTPLMVCLRARYYVVDDHLPKNSDQQVSYTNRNQITILKKTELLVH